MHSSKMGSILGALFYNMHAAKGHCQAGVLKR